MIAVTLAAVWLGLEPWHGVAAMPPSLAPTFLKMDVAGVFQLALVTMVLTLLLVMLLDTAGTLIGVARQAGFLDKEGRLPRAPPGAARRFGRCDARRSARHLDHHRLYRERGRRGGGRPHRPHRARRRGAVPASLFLAPLAQTVPPYATAPALLFVACLMATSLGAIQWDEPTEYIPALTIALMIPLSYSIATGIGLGFIAYVALKLLSGRVREINAASAVIAGAFLLKLIFA